MSLAGLEMVWFLPVVLALYWLMPRRAVLQNAVLLVASLVFYASWNPRLLLLLLASTTIDYACGLVMASATERGAGRRRAALALGIVANVGTLGLFKYYGFFAESLTQFLAGVGLTIAPPVLAFALPLGISYTTLIRVGYLIDVYYERVPACRDALVFYTFTAFFPQLLAGPITRARTMIPQLEAPRRLESTWIARGATALMLGFVLKAYVADSLGPAFVDPVFARPGEFGLVASWVALVAYAGQIFGDFAGYSLLAIGAGRLFAIELPENFRRPYLASSMAEFWRRWHISLNTWLFDYLWTPMVTGSGLMRGRVATGFVIVFLISGLWHGARWTFVCWGLAHGIALAIHHFWDVYYRGLCRKDRVWVARRKSRGYALSSWAITQAFFLLTLVPFRAGSAGEMLAFARGLAGAGGTRGLDLVSPALALPLALLVGYHALGVVPLDRLRERFFALPAPVRGAAYGLVVVFLALFAPVGAGTFIYAQF